MLQLNGVNTTDGVSGGSGSAYSRKIAETQFHDNGEALYDQPNMGCFINSTQYCGKFNSVTSGTAALSASVHNYAAGRRVEYFSALQSLVRAFTYDGSAFSAAVQTALGTDDTTYVTVPMATGVTGPVLYVGMDGPWCSAKSIVETAGVYDCVARWEYYNGSSWVPVDWTTFGDYTDGFKNTGTNYIWWYLPSDMAATTINATSRWWFRWNVITAGTVTTQPVLDLFQAMLVPKGAAITTSAGNATQLEFSASTVFTPSVVDQYGLDPVAPATNNYFLLPAKPVNTMFVYQMWDEFETASGVLDFSTKLIANSYAWAYAFCVQRLRMVHRFVMDYPVSTLYNMDIPAWFRPSLALTTETVDASAGNVNLNPTQAAKDVFLVSGVAGGGANLVFTAADIAAGKRIHVKNNDAADAITVKTGASTGVAVAATKAALLKVNADKTEVEVIYNGEAALHSFDGTSTYYDGEFYNYSASQRGFCPNYGNAALIAQHETSLLAMYNVLKQDPCCYMFQIGSWGHYGENHTFRTDGSSNPVIIENFISEDIVNNYISVYTENIYPDYWLEARRPFSAYKGKVGANNDAMGSYNQFYRYTFMGSIPCWKYGYTDIYALLRYLTVDSYQLVYNTTANETQPTVTVSETLDAADQAYITGKKMRIGENAYTVASAGANTIVFAETPIIDPVAGDIMITVAIESVPDYASNAPVAGEIIPPSNQAGGSLGATSEHNLSNAAYSQLVKQLEDYGTTFAGFTPDAGYHLDGGPVNMDDLHRRLGYRIYTKNVVVLANSGRIRTGEAIGLSVTFQNDGFAQFYDRWDFEITLLNTAGAVAQTVIPADDRADRIGKGETTITFDVPLSVSAGVYTIALAILDPVTQAPGVRLAQRSRPDKRHELISITVEGA